MLKFLTFSAKNKTQRAFIFENPLKYTESTIRWSTAAIKKLSQCNVSKIEDTQIPTHRWKTKGEKLCIDRNKWQRYIQICISDKYYHVIKKKKTLTPLLYFNSLNCVIACYFVCYGKKYLEDNHFLFASSRRNAIAALPPSCCDCVSACFIVHVSVPLCWQNSIVQRVRSTVPSFIAMHRAIFYRNGCLQNSYAGVFADQRADVRDRTTIFHLIPLKIDDASLNCTC